MILPEKVFDQHLIALGKTGAGKSSAMRIIVEHLLDKGSRVIVVTAKADWWGLKLSADGRHAGYPVVIFGGDHQDMPLHHLSGKTMADLLGTGNRSAVLQMRDFMPGERTTFWVDFAANLFRVLKGKLFLVIDEVHNFAPKGKVMDPKSAQMLHWSNKLASEARGLGITLIAASQRPAKVHNDFLTSCETLIAMRVTTKWDRDAVKDWISGCGDSDKGQEVLNSLAQMKRGDAWAWSPEIEFGPTRIHFPMFATYDSFKPQEPKEAASLKGWADVNLDDVRDKLASVVKEQEANDPAKLKSRIRELEADLRKKHPAINEIGADAKAIERATAATRRECAKAIATVHASQKALIANGGRLAKDLAAMAERAAKAFNVEIPKIRLPEVPTEIPPTNAAASRGARTARADEAEHVRKVHPSAENSSNGDIPRRQMDILRVLAEFEAIGRTPVPKNWIAARAGVSNSSGGFFNNLGSLRSAGLIEYPVPDTAQLTEAGRAKVPPPIDAPLNSEEMLASCLAILDKRKQDILKAVHASYPNAIPKPQLAEDIGVSATSGGYFNNLGALRSAGMIEYTSGGVKCADWLFIE